MPDKKKFKDGGEGSKIGNFLRSIDKESILKVASVATNIASGNWLGALGSIKGIIDNDPDISIEDKAQANRVIELEYADIASAREMYQSTDHKTADEIAKSVIKINLPLIMVLVILNIVAVKWFKDEASLVAIVSNFIGIAIGYLFNERQQVISFFFGSSRGSKEKSNLLNKK